MYPSVIYLVGMPGCGKTTLGKKLAGKLGYKFIDLDRVIEQAAGISIPEIFRSQGEAEFRNLESQILKATTGKDKVVIATGGGAPCFFDNMDFIKEAGISLYLEVSVEELLRRMNAKQKEERPLLASLEKDKIAEKLFNLFLARKAFYERADIRLSPDELSIDNIITKLFEA